MKKLLPLLIILFWALLTNAQWVEQTSGSTHWFNTVSFVDQNNGWICGSNGSDNMLVHTTDGGANWTPQAIPVTSFLAEVTFLNATTGWAVGNAGVLLKSTNGGDTWTPQTIAFTLALQSVWFADANNGWVVGQDGKIFHTTDGGTTWTPQTSNTTNRLIKVRFLNDQVGWASGWAGTILHTTNGGTTWVKQTTGTTFNLNSISIVDANNIWVCGIPGGGKDNSNSPLFDNGIILHTANGGTTWQTQLISSAWVLNSISFANLLEGWCFGSAIIYTSDGGVTWHPQVTPITTQLTAGQFTDNLHGWTAGEAGVILHTDNSGFSVGIGNHGNGTPGIKLSNDPNPFAGKTNISFYTPRSSGVEISIYDLCGVKVATVVHDDIQAGNHTIGWDASAMHAGVYFCTMKAGDATKTIKMIVK